MDADLITTTIQYMIGFGAGCASGYGFSLKQQKDKMELHNELLQVHKEQIKEMKEQINEMKALIFPNLCERRKNRGNCPKDLDRRNNGD